MENLFKQVVLNRALILAQDGWEFQEIHQALESAFGKYEISEVWQEILSTLKFRKLSLKNKDIPPNTPEGKPTGGSSGVDFEMPQEVRNGIKFNRKLYEMTKLLLEKPDDLSEEIKTTLQKAKERFEREEKLIKMTEDITGTKFDLD